MLHVFPCGEANICTHGWCGGPLSTRPSVSTWRCCNLTEQCETSCPFPVDEAWEAIWMQVDNVKRETCKEHQGNRTGRPVNSHNLYHSAERQTQSAESCSHVSHDSKSCWEHFDGATWNDEMTHHLSIALKGGRVLLYDICISFHHCNSLIMESQCSCRTQRRFRMILLCFMGLFFYFLSLIFCGI